MKGFVNIARCAEHGLHGERAECFVCGAAVKQIPMVPCDDAAVARAAAAADLHSNAHVGWHAASGTYAVHFSDVAAPDFKVVEGYRTASAAAADVGRLRAVAVLRAAGAVAFEITDQTNEAL